MGMTEGRPSPSAVARRATRCSAMNARVLSSMSSSIEKTNRDIWDEQGKNNSWFLQTAYPVRPCLNLSSQDFYQCEISINRSINARPSSTVDEGVNPSAGGE